MSYCVNCGVELAKSEPKCPLCGVVVSNPASPWKEPPTRPYPAYLETVMRGVDRRFFSAVAALLLMIPVGVCLLVDLLTSYEIVWSGYVIGSAACLAATVLFPLAYGRGREYLCLVIDAAVVLSFLCYIDIRQDGAVKWFLPLAMPVTVSFSVITGLIMLYLKKRKHRALLVTAALVLAGAGVFTVAIDIFIKVYNGLAPIPTWSLYALVPCALTGAAFFILNSRQKWKESVRKRLFF